MLTVKMVEEEIEKIKAIRLTDHESKHIAEKELWEKVLVYIAKVDSSLAGLLAKEALKTSEIDFERWFA